jgi:hypothetical protein
MANAKKPKVSVEVTQEQYDLYRRWAEFQGQSLSDWVRRSLGRSVPADAEARMEAAEGLAKGREEAFSQLDEEDRLQGLQPKTNGAAPMRLPVAMAGNTRHQCVHLLDKIPPNYRIGEVQGTCGAPNRGGRPCMWPSHTAHNCDVFERRRGNAELNS